jgi:cytochrome b561
MRHVQIEALPRGRFDALTIVFHWATFALIVAQAVTGLSIDLTAGTPFGDAILVLHRSTGIAVWSVALLRLCWRLNFARLPPFPRGMRRAQRFAVTASEYFLYTLLLVQPVTGFAASVLRGRSFALFDWTVPAISAPLPKLASFLFALHAAGAWTLFALIGGHALAALAHHYIGRDDVLKTMAPWVRRLPSKSPRLARIRIQHKERERHKG